MSLQTPEQIMNYLQGQIYIWAGAAVALGIAFTVVAGLWFWKNHNRTKTSKLLDQVKGKPVQLLLAASKGSWGKLIRLQDFNPEGVLENKKFKDRTKGKEDRKIFASPRKINVGSTNDIMATLDFPEGTTDEQKNETSELTRQFLQNMIDLNNYKIMLQGVGVPISVAVEDKIITANIPGLGVLEFYRKLDNIQKIKAKIDALKANVAFHDVGNALEYLYNKISLVPFDMIREYFPASYDQTNKKAQNEWHHMQGFRDGVASVKHDKEQGKMFLYMGLGLGIAGLAGGIAFAFLGK